MLTLIMTTINLIILTLFYAEYRKKETAEYINHDNVVGNSGILFPPDEETVYSISLWHADNEIVSEELRISLSPSDWCKFASQPFYSPLIQYLDNLRIQKQKEHLDAEKDSKGIEE